MCLSRVAEEAYFQTEECARARGTARYANLRVPIKQTSSVPGDSRLTVCIAQVETLLKGVNDAAVAATDSSIPKAKNQARVELDQEDIYPFPPMGTVRTTSEDLSPDAQVPFVGHDLHPEPAIGLETDDWQLMELGMSEAPPPWNVIEELYVLQS